MRFRMLDTVRDYCAEQLDAEERLRALALHFDYFRELAEEANPKLKGQEQAAWMDRLDMELDNLRAALDRQSGEAGLHLAAALWWFWYVRGYLSEGRARLTQVLTQTAGSGPAADRAKALHGAGVLARDQGDYAAARTLTEECLALYRELGDRPSIAVAFHNLALIAQDQGDYGTARTLYAESVALKRELGDKRGIAGSLNGLGLVAYRLGENETAHTLYEESLTLFREVGDQWGVGNSLHGLACIAESQGDYGTARTLYAESAALFRALGNKRGVALAIAGLAWLSHYQDDFETARTLHEESLTLRREVGDKWGISHSLVSFAALFAAQGQPARAAQLWGAAEALREQIHIPLMPGFRDEYERMVAGARNQAGEAAFAAAWNKGRSLTLEQAIECALRRTHSTPNLVLE
jgi:tetratricopeptide (TPR) repeat protein